MMTLWDRQSPRIPFQVPIGVLQLDEQRLMSATSVNVSEGGMFLGSEELLDIGTELVCNVPLERQEEAIQLKARVAWLRPSWHENDKRPRGMGIEFIESFFHNERHHFILYFGICSETERVR